MHAGHQDLPGFGRLIPRPLYKYARIWYGNETMYWAPEMLQYVIHDL